MTNIFWLDILIVIAVLNVITAMIRGLITAYAAESRLMRHMAFLINSIPKEPDDGSVTKLLKYMDRFNSLFITIPWLILCVVCLPFLGLGAERLGKWIYPIMFSPLSQAEIEYMKTELLGKFKEPDATEPTRSSCDQNVSDIE